MNKFYRIIWNNALQCFVVTSEFAKSKGKAASKIVMAAALSSFVSIAHAETTINTALPANNALSVTTSNSLTSPESVPYTDTSFTPDMLNRSRMTRALTANAPREVSSYEAGTTYAAPVEISQLKPLVEALGGGAKINIATGVITGPEYLLQQIDKTTGLSQDSSNPITSVGEALKSVSSSLSNLSDSTLHYADSEFKTSVRLGGIGGTKITNLKSGELSVVSTDAINGSQLYTTNNNFIKYFGGGARIDSSGDWTGPTYSIQGTTVDNVGDAFDLLDYGVNTNAGNINNLTENITKGIVGLVKRDPMTNNLTVDADGEGENISFAGKKGVRTLDGLKDATLDKNSAEAVNGSQLFTTNSNISDMATSLGGGAKVGDDGKFVAPSYTVQKKTVNTVSEALDALDDGTTKNSNDISNLTTNINNGSVGLVQQDAGTQDITVAATSGGNSISIVGTDGERTLTGLKDAALNDMSTEAVNGKQLFATNQNVQKNSSNITNIAKNLGGDAAVDEDGNFVAPEYTVQGAQKNNVSDAITGLDNGITQNAGDITDLTNNINNGTVGLVQQATPDSNITVAALSGGNSVSFKGTNGSRRLTDVSFGLSDEDAVNISQLKDLLSEFGSNGSIDSSTGKITGPTYRINGKDLNLSGSLTDLDSRIGKLGNGGTGNTDHLIAYDDIEHKSVTLGGKDSDSSVSVGNVADGKVEKDSKDAVNGGQLHEVKNQVAQNTTDINNIKNNVDGITNGTAGLVQQDPETNDITVGKDKGGDKVSLANNTGKDRILSGVANGVADNDAATIAQVKDLANASTSSTLAANNTSKRDKPIASGKDTIALGAGAQSSADNSMALGSNAKSSGNNAVALGNNSIADRANSLSVGSVGNERQITNVGRATAGTDAVNLNQLNEGLSALNDNTNQHFRDIDKNINHLKNQLRGGIASAMAMGSLPQPYSAGSGMMSMGGATFHGESAMAIGASKVSENGHWVTKLQGSTNTQGDLGVSAGVGYQW